jgi:hypothetical protein
MLSVVMLNVVMLSIVEPVAIHKRSFLFITFDWAR